MQNYCITVPFYDGKELCAVVAYDQYTCRVLYSEQFLELLQSMGILKVFLAKSIYDEVRKMAEINNAFTLEITYAIANNNTTAKYENLLGLLKPGRYPYKFLNGIYSVRNISVKELENISKYYFFRYSQCIKRIRDDDNSKCLEREMKLFPINFYGIIVEEIQETGEAKRIHKKCHTNQYGTVTARITTSNPNIQGLSKEEWKTVVPHKGRVILTADYSAIDLLIGALLAEDYELAPKCVNTDIHTENCKEIFGVCTDSLRKIIKSMVYSIMYGAGKGQCISRLNKVADELKQTTFSANEIYDKLQVLLGCILTYRDSLTDVGCTAGGRHFYFERNKIEKYKRLSYIIQSIQSEVLKEALIMLQEYDYLLLVTIHDSIIIEVNKNAVQSACQNLTLIMQKAFCDVMKTEIKINIKLERKGDFHYE